MAAGQTATVTDDGWKTISGPEDDGWKTISGATDTAGKIAAGKPSAKPSAFQQFKQGFTESLHPKSGPNAGMAERFVNSTVSNFGDAASALAHGHPLDAAGDLLTGYSKAYVPEALAGAGTAGAALLRGSVRPALGLVAGAGTGIAVHKAATALGAPEWLAELASSAAGLAVGGKVGMTPEMQAKFKSTGFRGIIQRWVNGEPKQNEVLEFYKQQHGKLPTTPEEIMTAKAEAAAFKKQVAVKLKEATSPEAQKADKLKEAADRIRAERGEPTRFDKSGVKAADIPDLTREPTAAPESKPKTTEEKIAAGRSSAKPTVRVRSETGQLPAPRAEQVPEPSRDEEALGRAHQGFAADVNKRMGGKLLAKGLTPDQVMQMDEDEFYRAVGPDRKFRGKLDPATGKPTSTHRTFEQGRNDVAAWMKLQAGKRGSFSFAPSASTKIEAGRANARKLTSLFESSDRGIERPPLPGETGAVGAQVPKVPGKLIGRTTGRELGADKTPYKAGFGIYEIPIDRVIGTEDISGSPDKLRDAAEYMEKIKAGSPVPPLWGHVDESGNVSIQGARRLLAAKRAGLKTVPVAIGQDYLAGTQ